MKTLEQLQVKRTKRQGQLKQLDQQIDELEKAAQVPTGRIRPEDVLEYGQKYYYLLSTGVARDHYTAHSVDTDRIKKCGLAYYDQGPAESAYRYRELLTAYENAAAKSWKDEGVVMDFNDGNQRKYCALQYSSLEEYTINSYGKIKFQGAIYFQNGSAIRNHLDALTDSDRELLLMGCE